MKNYLCSLILVIFTVPLFAQNSEELSQQQQFQEMFEQLSSMQAMMMKQFSDSTMQNQGFYQFFNFGDGENPFNGMQMDDLQEMMERQLDSQGFKDGDFGTLEPLQFNMDADSLIQQFESILGKDLELIVPEELKEPKQNGNKKRKTYSL